MSDDPKDARAFFDAVARRYDRVYALTGAASKERLARVLAAIAGKRRVLVLGIGTGRELPALLDAGHEVTGLDVSREMLAVYRRRSRVAPSVVADFWAPLPFDDGAFDAVIALHGTIAHPPRDGALSELGREIARVLADGGVFVAEVPAGEAIARIEGADAAEGVHVEATGATSFVHHDEVAGVALAGVALTADGWRTALAPGLDARAEPLGALEHFVVARPRR